MGQRGAVRPVAADGGLGMTARAMDFLCLNIDGLGKLHFVISRLTSLGFGIGEF
jgi:hypothetical protein